MTSAGPRKSARDHQTMARRPDSVLRAVLRVPVLLYRGRLGWLLGHRFLLLVHTGRRSGARHEAVLEVVQYDAEAAEATVISGWGAGADWYRNVRAGAPTEIVIGRRRYAVEHRVLDEDEAHAVIERYEVRNRWMRPIVRKVLSAPVGWRYDGSEESRRRLVRQLPLIAFRPATA